MERIVENMIPIFGIIFTFGIPGLIIFWVIYTKHKERMRLIEKGLTPEEVKQYFSDPEKPKNPYSGLKWGLILAFLGAGIIVSNILYDKMQLSDGYTGGFVILSIGLGYLVYFIIVKSKTDNDRFKKQTETKNS
jgi:hypothetical protein